MALAALVSEALGPDVPVGVRAYDGSSSDPPGAVATLVVRRPEALRRFITSPGELGLGRAYVAGDLDVEGDLFAALAGLADHLPKIDPRVMVELAKIVGVNGLRPLPPPPEETRLHGFRHSRRRDAAAIAHHYDVSNDFYRLVLGPSMTYSCAVWHSPDGSLEDAQTAKYELVSRKLDLQPGMRLLDVGCGWGGMVMHAAAHHGVEAVGVTISQRQAELATQRVRDAGLADQVEIRIQDYRDVPDGPYDAISSIGMFEHVGLAHLQQYFDHLRELLRPEGRLLNHGISRPADGRERRRLNPPKNPLARRRTFIDRFVFPDGELHEIGRVVSTMHLSGLEVRHTENLREHYALTLRQWVANLDAAWTDAVAIAGEGRARVWRLYMAASAVGFEAGRIQIHQTLGVNPDHGRSGMALRPVFEDADTAAAGSPT